MDGPTDYSSHPQVDSENKVQMQCKWITRAFGAEAVDQNSPNIKERCIYMNILAHFLANLLNHEQIWFILMQTLSVWS